MYKRQGENDPIELKLAKDTLKRIKSAQDAKKAQAAKEEQNRTLAEEFLKEYRDAVFSSVSNRNNTYSKYYDTQSQAYKDMVEFTTGDGVRKAKIDYYTCLLYTSLKSSVRKTKRQYDGQTIYEVVDKRIPGLKKGDQLYLDGLHKDHIEVFDKRGRFRKVINLDGSKNIIKSDAGVGRSI